jgi:hypothetical protein
MDPINENHPTEIAGSIEQLNQDICVPIQCICDQVTVSS